MLAAIQNVSASFPPAATASIPTGERFSQQAEDAASALITPSFIVSLGAVLRAPLTYNADGLLETQATAATAVASSLDTVTSAAVRAASTQATTSIALTAAPPNEAEPATAPASGFAISPAAVTDTFATFIPGAPGTTDVAAAPPPIAAIPAAATAEDAISFVASLPGSIAFAPAAATTPPSAGADPASAFIPAPAGTIAVASPETAVVAPLGAGETAAAGTGPALARNAAAVDTPTPDIAARTAAEAADIVAPVTQPVPDTTTVTAPAQPLAALVSTSGTPAPAATAVAQEDAGATQATTTLVDAATLAHRNIAQNPFYAGLAATMYVNAMVFRLQQSSSAELPQSAEIQPVAGLRAVAPVSFDRNGPADEERDGGSLERRTIASSIGTGTAPEAVGG